MLKIRSRLYRKYLLNLIAMGFLFSMGTKVTATTLDPTLERGLTLIEAYRINPSSLNELRLRHENLSVSKDPILKVFLYFDHTPGTADYDLLTSKSIIAYPNTYIPPVGGHPRGFLIAEGAASSIRNLSSSNHFPRITAAYRKLSPKNDLAAQETGVAEARTWAPPRTGQGVRLAILDSGFRFEHPDLPQPAAVMDYSAYPDTARDVTDLISGHGTHVAGTAFGRGWASGGRWEGMAPSADPIYFKIGDDTSGDASSAAVMGAIRGTAAWADANILSMSYGGWDGFNDGSSAEEQAVDWAVSQGVNVFMSAGNSGAANEHFSLMLEPNSTSEPIQVIVKFAPDSATWGFALVWVDGRDTTVHRNMTARLFNGQNFEIGLDSLPHTSSPRGTEYQEYLSSELLPVDSSAFYIRVTNHSDFAQKFHLWTLSSHWYVRFSRADQGTTVLLPSTADSCISVGAYTSRVEWRDFTGNNHIDRTVRGEIAGFSSIGPRIDGLLKPDICAPGRRVISCRDTFNIRFDDGLDYAIVSSVGDSGLPADYVAFMGTSMSSPAAAGSAAIILEEEPDLNPSQLRSLIFSRARRDNQTGRTPNPIWGWGKIDVVRALSVTAEELPSGDIPSSFGLLEAYPNPANGSVTLRYQLISPDELILTIHDTNGRTIWSRSLPKSTPGEKTANIPAEAINASGVYLVKLQGETMNQSTVVTIVR